MSKSGDTQKNMSQVNVDEKGSDLSKNDNLLAPTSKVARAWSPSHRHRFPIFSFIALIVVLASAGGLIAVIYNSDGKNSNDWCSTTRHFRGKPYTLTITSNVWISIIIFISGKAMAYTFAEAVTTAWWVKAMDGKTLKELHHNWEAGKSIMGVLKNPWMFNIICLGSIAFTCFAGLATIFQKSTKVVTGTEITHPAQSAYVAVNFPAGWSGSLTNDANPVFQASDDLSKILYEFSKGYDLDLDVNLCQNDNQTSCDLVLPAAGFQWDCEAGELPFSGYDPSYFPDSEGNVPNKTLSDPDAGVDARKVAVFKTAVDWDYPGGVPDTNSAWSAWLNITFKANELCLNTTVQYRNCRLTPALINYPITVREKTPVLKSATAQPNWSGEAVPEVLVDSVNKNLPYPLPVHYETPFSAGVPVTMGLLFKALNNIIGMSAYYNPAYGPGGVTAGSSFVETGAYTSTYVKKMFSVDSSLAYSTDQCNSTWADPTADIALQIRQFMFRTAITLANRNVSSVQSSQSTFEPYEIYTHSKALQVTQQRTIPVYQSNYTFLWIGVALMVSSALTTVPLFYGYWRLGRAVSLSPLELAKALSDTTANDAPNIFVTDNADMSGSNAETKELLENFGDRKIKYGEVAPQVLGFSFKERVVTPKVGQSYL